MRFAATIMENMGLLPLWIGLISIAGLGLLAGGAFVDDGTYLQSLLIELGAAVLLFAPILVAERSIASLLRKRLEDVAAIARTEQFQLADDIVRHWGQALGRPRPPKTSSQQMGRMLGADGWKPLKVRDGHEIWTKDEQMLAVPLNEKALNRGMTLGTMRYVRWPIERYVELWNATRDQGVDAFDLQAERDSEAKPSSSGPSSPPASSEA